MRSRDLEQDTKLDPPGLPEIWNQPPARGKVLVLAPHADDETIGVGATMVMHRDLGDSVDVLYLTNGMTGNADNRYTPEEYIRIRSEEARAACAVLGVNEIFFWEYPDNYQVSEQDMDVLLPRLVEILDKGGYDVIYTPHWGEMHSDHHVAAVLAARAVRKWNRPVSLLGYEIWAPIESAEIVVNVTRTYPVKLEAAACYQSQIALRDIVRLFKCLNGYRSAFMENQGTYGEAFIRMGYAP